MRLFLQSAIHLVYRAFRKLSFLQANQIPDSVSIGVLERRV